MSAPTDPGERLTNWGWCGGAPCEGDHGYGPELRTLCMGTPWRAMVAHPGWRALLAKWRRRVRSY